MKKTYCNLAAAFAFAFAAPAVFAADDGDIYEFKPVTSVVSSDSALGAAQTVNFKMRLLSPNYTNAVPANRIQWEVFYKPNPFPATISEYAKVYGGYWAISPLKLGVVVSGQTRGAVADDLPSPYHDNRLTEITFSYTTAYGDLALPLKLATDKNGNAVGDGLGGFVPSTDGQYCFLNDDLWGIGYVPDGKERTSENIVWMKPYRRQTLTPSMLPPDGTRNGSFDLAYGFDPDNAGGAYFIKTIGFDSKSVTDSAGTFWLIVN